MSNNFYFKPDDPQFRRVLMINVALPIAIAIAFVFSWVAYTIQLYPVMISNFIAGVAAVVTLIDFHRRHSILFAAVVMMVLETVILIVLIWFVGFGDYVLVWIVIIPITSYFLLGRTGGRVFTIGVTIIVLLFILFRYPLWTTQGYSFVGVLNLGCAYLALVLMVSYYELTMQEALNNLKQKNHELARLSVTDKLTGAYNRIKLDAFLGSEIDHYRKTGKPFSIMIGDLDYFKLINDRLGHLVGDQVLKEIARIMVETIRETDICGRWGGEEFMIISPNTSLEGAVFLGEKLRRSIELYFIVRDHPVTMSFGVAEFCPEDTVETLIKRADDALYRAKELGRNRVEY